jgi:hypothetical protein
LETSPVVNLSSSETSSAVSSWIVGSWSSSKVISQRGQVKSKRCLGL